jgi:hypothetical protein
MQHYSFVTNWRFSYPVSAVWPLIKDIAGWPEWWKGVTDVKINKEGEPDGCGKCAAIKWRSALPYSLSFELEVTKIIEFKKIIGFTTGDLKGKGIWEFFPEDNNSSSLCFYWDVDTTLTWMNTLAPVLKPVFKWNHDVVMKWGQEGLKEKLVKDFSNSGPTG